MHPGVREWQSLISGNGSAGEGGFVYYGPGRCLSKLPPKHLVGLSASCKVTHFGVGSYVSKSIVSASQRQDAPCSSCGPYTYCDTLFQESHMPCGKSTTSQKVWWSALVALKKGCVRYVVNVAPHMARQALKPCFHHTVGCELSKLTV